MQNLLRKLFFVIIFCFPWDSRAQGNECFLMVEQKVIIDGACRFTALRGGDFQIANRWHFAIVNIDQSKANGYWNEEAGAGHAHTPLGELTRNGGCWQNERNVVCAWKSGSRPKEFLSAMAKSKSGTTYSDSRLSDLNKDNCERSVVASSVIDWIEFCEQSGTKGTMTIHFNSSARYDYYEVPRSEFSRLINAPSKGVHFNSEVRANFACRRVSGPPLSRSARECDQ
jgi:hypothetical protein